ncbi:MAG: glycogen debranching enzyme family protein, partial [Phycisphaerales bacterium]|nr:glycogen debranching enzyme family protein [Phycisphaerales bacterium]
MHSPTEWLETDGLGGFAGGTVDGVRTRRYHGLLVAAATPPTGRMLLVNGLDAEVMTPRGRFALTAQRYAPDAVHPADVVPVDAFTAEPWPTWRWRLPDGTTVVHELFIARVIARATSTVVLRWRQESTERGVMLGVRPYLSGRDYHALHHENPNFRWDCEERDGTHRWQPYPDVPPVHVRTNGARRDDAHWYRQVRYAEELARGFECDEDVAAPCVFEYDLDAADAVMMLSTHPTSRADAAESAVDTAARHRRDELARRRAFASPLHRAADQYIVRRGAGTSIIAGYPWFTDWGRDTFIAMRGLCLTTGRLDDARSMLVTWAGAISQGMIPNRFP